MTIRKAVAGDLQAIDEFDIFLGNRLREIQRDEIWVAESDGRISGYISFNDQFYERPFVHFLMVKEDSRRSGIAIKLMLKFEELHSDKEQLFTSTESNNLPMLILLDKLGYKCCGVVDKIQRESEIVFCKEKVIEDLKT